MGFFENVVLNYDADNPNEVKKVHRIEKCLTFFLFLFFIDAAVLNNSSCVLRVVWLAKTLISTYVSLILPIANEVSCAA